MNRFNDKKNTQRLYGVMKYAYEHVPYFNHIFNSRAVDIDNFLSSCDMDQLPVFSKNTIIQYGYSNFVSNEYIDDNGNLNTGLNICVRQTSGTTDKSMDIVWNRVDYLNSVRSHWDFRKKVAKITPMSMTLSAVSMPDEKEYDVQGRFVYVNINNLSDESIKTVYSVILELKPEWIYTFGSVAYVLFRKFEKLDLPVPSSIRYIELIGEPLLIHYKRYIEERFGSRVFDCYGCTETNGIAYTCENGNHHLLKENVLTEIICEGKRVPYGTTGYICVTGLHNKAMPMIRYQLNDIAEMYDGNRCSCGAHTDFIKLHITRIPKILIMDDSNIFSKAYLYFALDRILPIVGSLQNSIPFCLEYIGVRKYRLIFPWRYLDKADVLNTYIHTAFLHYGLGELQLNVDFRELPDQCVNGFFVLRHE